MEAFVEAAFLVEKYSSCFTVYLAAVNLLAFVLYAIDKASAKRGAWRIPEVRLIGVALIGGSLGAFSGMVLLRHKTKHTKFIVGLPLILALHTVILLAGLLLVRFY